MPPYARPPGPAGFTAAQPSCLTGFPVKAKTGKGCMSLVAGHQSFSGVPPGRRHFPWAGSLSPVVPHVLFGRGPDPPIGWPADLLTLSRGADGQAPGAGAGSTSGSGLDQHGGQAASPLRSHTSAPGRCSRRALCGPGTQERGVPSHPRAPRAVTLPSRPVRPGTTAPWTTSCRRDERLHIGGYALGS